jgi:hypothetical protein
MNNIEFNKHDVDIFINGTWQKYAGNVEIDLGVCFLQFDWLIFLGNYYHVGFKKGREAGLTLEGEVVALGRLTSISH